MVDLPLIMENIGAMAGIFLACATGIPVPEEITLISSGVLASTGSFPLFLVLATGLAGIIACDTTLYFLGRNLGPRVFQLPLLRDALTGDRVEWAGSRIRRDGPLVCFVGRFLPGLRIVIFAASGAFGIKPRAFLATDALAAAIDVTLWVSLGNWLGSSLVDATRSASEIKVGLFSAALLVIGFNVLRRLAFRKRAEEPSEPAD